MYISRGVPKDKVAYKGIPSNFPFDIYRSDCYLELLSREVHHNTIVSLGTGTGKTFIAVLLIKEYAFRLLANNQKVVFLVDKVALVEQQAAHIESHTSLSVGKMHGKYTNWSKPEEWHEFFKKHHVLVLTAQVLVDLINHGYFDISTAALIILNECHHSMGRRHPYRVILDGYRKLPPDQRGRILGLTASVLNKRMPLHRLEESLKNLEEIMCSRLEPINDLCTTLKYGAKPTRFVQFCHDDTPKASTARKILNRLLQFVNRNCEFQPDLDIDPRQPIREAINRTFSILDQLGSWCAWKVSFSWQKRIAKFIEDPVLGNKQKRILHMAETAFRTCTRILGDDVQHVRSCASLLPFVSSRMSRVIEILREYEPSVRTDAGYEDPMFCLIFVDQRYVAYIINVLLKMLAKWEPKDFGFIRPDFVVGHTGIFVDTDEANAAHKRQEHVLYKFRNGALNLLVSTNVLEEGIDVRNCNLVIRFDPPVDFRSYVQSRGRARKDKSHFFILANQCDHQRITEDMNIYEQIEEFLLKRYKSEDDAIVDEERHGMIEIVDSIVEPYVVAKTNARVTMSTAIGLVNRYCSKLPSDVFTRLVPQIHAHPIKGPNGTTLFQAELVFPINSPVKKIITLPYPLSTKAHALRAVALKACRILHEEGELNDNLLPMGKDTVANLLSELDDEDLPYIAIKPGSAKRRRLYDRKMSKHVLGTLALPNQPCYIYVMDMRLVKPISEEGNPKRRRIMDPTQVDSAFGFLSSKLIPCVPGFPIFQRQGEMEVHIVKAFSIASLSENDLNLVELFHIHVFNDILRVGRGGVGFAPEQSPIPFLIVPLRKFQHDNSDGLTITDYKLDYGRLSETIREPPKVPLDEVRKNFKLDEAMFFDAVVMPWYRCSEQFAYYYVAEVCRNQNPASPFPDEKFKSFNEYFWNKYQIKIFDQEQCLLDVDHTSARMNLLLPRITSARNAKKYLDPSQRQVLVPELLHIHPLSAPLWTMLIGLPTVMYRMNALLLADEFRHRVMTEAFDMNPNTSSNFEWPKLEYATVNSDNTQQPIKNLDQLKKIISAEQEVAMDQSSEFDDDTEGDERSEKGTPSFNIEVWNPADAVEFQNPDPVLTNCSKGPQMADDEAIAMGNVSIHNFGDMSDEELDAEEDYDILLDFKTSMHEKLAHLREPFEPSDDCDVSAYGNGWDDDESNVAKIDLENIQFPLAISSNSKDIDVTALMRDLESSIGQPAYQGGASGANTGGAVTAAGAQRAAQKKMYLDSMEAMDASDRLTHRKQKEEVVDVLEFDESQTENDGERCEIMDTESSDEDSAFEENSNSMNDLPTIPTPDLINGTFKIFAPDLPWMRFSFEEDLLSKNPFGVPPTLLLQALTTSSASDGINLERLETIGDSFLKLAVTNYLYHKHVDQHEGKLSFARSKEVSNSRLFNLGKRRGIPYLMEASKFDPHVNWLPPGYASTTEFHALNPLELDESAIDESQMESADGAPILVQKKEQSGDGTGWGDANAGAPENYKVENGVETITFTQSTKPTAENPDLPPLPYNMLTQQYVSDKSIADSVEALIGAHLVSLGPMLTLKFMSWLGVKVLTEQMEAFQPLLRFIDTEREPDRSKNQLTKMYIQFSLDQVEQAISYEFGNKAYLLQAFTHASYYKNQVTGCYQRLEFLGDAVLDYLITRFLFEHEKQYSPGVLTDLRSALVNNTIFASLAVKFGFHKHFIAICPGLYHMIEKFVNLCKSKGNFEHCTNFDDEMFMITEDEIDEGHEEDIEVPKALGDIFESIAGAVYLDCGMNLDIVWRVFYNLMKESIEECCRNPPQSPVRELFERKNCKARFTKLERVLETGKVRVTVDVNDMRFVGMGRSYRIAKSTAAKRALKHLRGLEKSANGEKDKNPKK